MIAGPFDVLTPSGALVNLKDPAPSTIHLRDIAHCLSRICRFGGATAVHVSVAQHCILVSHLVPPEMAAWGLLHDAHEAYLGDVSTPLKRLLRWPTLDLPSDFDVIAGAWDDTISRRFGVPIRTSCGSGLSLKQADTIAMLAERRAFGPYGMTDSEFLGCSDSGFDISDLPPVRSVYVREAERAFLDRAEELGIHG